MTPATAAAALLVFALGLSSLRLAAGVRAKRLPLGRALIRVAGQALLAGLLWFALFPPNIAAPGAGLVVLTPGSNQTPPRDNTDTWVSLPGVQPAGGVEAVPDLGTALRRHPGLSPVRVFGHGLPERDRDAAAGQTLVFDPAALPDGLLQLDGPDAPVQGQIFRVRGRVQGFEDGRMELVDAADAVLASTALDGTGEFVLSGRAGLAGRTPFTLRWYHVDESLGGEEVLHLDVQAPAPARLLLLSGGPSPELKYLRRWAVDAGLSQHSVIELGGGVQLGDAPLPINAATLAGFDLVVLDERAWRQLGQAGRTSLRNAVREGLGVLLRITGPLDRNDRETLGDWGLVLADADGVRGLVWPEAAKPDASADAGDPAPVLSRRPLRMSARDGRALHVAPDGDALVAWRNEGRGRIGATLISDSHRLWLTGRRAAYGQLWADTVQTLARARGDGASPRPVNAWLHERTTLCGVTPGDAVLAPDGTRVSLVLDPASGSAACAGYWPEQLGRHLLVRGDEQQSLLVRDPARYPAMLAAQRQAATFALAAQSPSTDATPQPRAGPRWPWWLAWLLASTALWWFERRVVQGDSSSERPRPERMHAP